MMAGYDSARMRNNNEAKNTEKKEENLLFLFYFDPDCHQGQIQFESLNSQKI